MAAATGAVTTAAVGTTKVYLGICIALAAVGGSAAAISGSGWMAKTTGTGVGAGIGSAPSGISAGIDTYHQARKLDTPAAKTGKGTTTP